MTNEEYMIIALDEAKKSLKTGDVPVGAVIVKDGVILAQAHNLRMKQNRTIAHAEIMAIEKANKKVKNYRLDGAILYVTKEPCLMCMGAILSAHIDKIYYGVKDKRFGTEHIAKDNNFNCQCDIEGGILENESKKLLESFFKDLRGE